MSGRFFFFGSNFYFGPEIFSGPSSLLLFSPPNPQHRQSYKTTQTLRKPLLTNKKVVNCLRSICFKKKDTAEYCYK